MKKVIALAVLMAFMMPVVAFPVFAAEGSTTTAVTDVGNKFCPVSGDPVSGQNFVTYQGKRYGLCCPGCDKKFLAEPEKYLAKMNAQEAAPAQEPMREAEHSHHEM